MAKENLTVYYRNKTAKLSNVAVSDAEAAIIDYYEKMAYPGPVCFSENALLDEFSEEYGVAGTCFAMASLIEKGVLFKVLPLDLSGNGYTVDPVALEWDLRKLCDAHELNKVFHTSSNILGDWLFDQLQSLGNLVNDQRELCNDP